MRILSRIDRFLGTPPLGRGSSGYAIRCLLVFLILGCIWLFCDMREYDSGPWPLVPLFVGVLLCCVLMFFTMPYLFLGMGGIGSSVVAFAVLGYDTVNFVYLLPLLLAGCSCVIRGMRHDERDTGEGEQVKMNTDYSSRLEELLASGVSFEGAMASLRRDGASAIETIVAIRIVKKIGLGEAKKMFSASSSWQDVNEAADKLHQEILDAWDDETEAEQDAPADPDVRRDR